MWAMVDEALPIEPHTKKAIQAYLAQQARQMALPRRLEPALG